MGQRRPAAGCRGSRRADRRQRGCKDSARSPAATPSPEAPSAGDVQVRAPAIGRLGGRCQRLCKGSARSPVADPIIRGAEHQRRASSLLHPSDGLAGGASGVARTLQVRRPSRDPVRRTCKQMCKDNASAVVMVSPLLVWPTTETASCRHHHATRRRPNVDRARAHGWPTCRPASRHERQPDAATRHRRRCAGRRKPCGEVRATRHGSAVAGAGCGRVRP